MMAQVFGTLPSIHLSVVDPDRVPESWIQPDPGLAAMGPRGSRPAHGRPLLFFDFLCSPFQVKTSQLITLKTLLCVSVTARDMHRVLGDVTTGHKGRTRY